MREISNLEHFDFISDDILDYYFDDTRTHEADFIINYSAGLRLEFILREACCAQFL